MVQRLGAMLGDILGSEAVSLTVGCWHSLVRGEMSQSMLGCTGQSWVVGQYTVGCQHPLVREVMSLVSRCMVGCMGLSPLTSKYLPQIVKPEEDRRT